MDDHVEEGRVGDQTVEWKRHRLFADCPHLGCGYRWDDADHHFKCPCHGSVYDIAGKVVGGPPPRPLDAL